MAGLGFIDGGLELTIGRFGSLPVTLLRTSMFAKVWFLFGATMGISLNVSSSKWSTSRLGQFVEMISLAALHNGPYLIGRTMGALLESLSGFDMYSCLLVNGYSRRMEVIDSALYPLSINFSFNCFRIDSYVSSCVLDLRYRTASPLWIAFLTLIGW